MTNKTKKKQSSGKLFVVSAPSGAGKTTLVTRVIERLNRSYDLKRVITYTSKQPRPGEVQGVDYHFLAEEEFKEKIASDYFVEYSTVYGAFYGFPRYIIAEIYKGASYIVIVDREGATSLKAHIKETVLIWIRPPNKEELEKRLINRAQDSNETIAFRLGLADAELSNEVRYLFDNIIINDDLERAVDELATLIEQNLQDKINF